MGHLFAVKDVIVAENNMYYKTTQNKYKIIVVKKTQVCEIFEDTFPSYMYEFKSFDEVKNQEIVDEKHFLVSYNYFLFYYYFY